MGSTEKFYRNTAATGSDAPPDAKNPGEWTTPDRIPGKPRKYPRREELKPTPLETPDPSKAETSQELKTSLPDYGSPKEFLQNIGETVRATEKLFELLSEEKTERAEEQRGLALGFADAVKESLYSFKL